MTVAPDPAEVPGRPVLAIGRPVADPVPDPAFSAALPSDVVWVPADAVDAALLARLDPRLVLCPLLGAGFDALQVAERLERLGWTGRLRVLAPALPAPAMVEAELAARAPGLTVDLVCLA
jgi:hypothetical protein